MKVLNRADTPHKGILWIRGEVQELLATGECSGKPVHKSEPFVIAVDGVDKEDAIAKLTELILKIKGVQNCLSS